jgi:hypothetical protein
MIFPMPRRPQRGFALLITITLLAFLVLLLVSLASLTRVETQVAGNNQRLSQARQNALLAVNIALGQLQQFAGPDQRITARADVLTSHAGSPVATGTSGAFDTFWATRNRYWTGVWGNSQSAIGYDLRPDQINRRGVTPELLNWLISGNETATYALNGNKGGVTAGTGASAPRFLPGGAVTNLMTANALSTNITIADKDGNPHPAVLLVGPQSAGAAAAGRNDYVVAPLRDLPAAASAIPGASSTATGTVNVGRYAWWIGDEGIKARVNLQNGYQKTGQATDQIHSFLVAQRSAVEYMNSTSAGPAIGTAYDSSNAQVSRLIELKQLALSGANATSQATLTNAASNRFHDLTASSYGVLADTYAGGLKKDLTADIAAAPSPSGGMPTDATTLFTPLSASDANLPTWGHLRSWVRTPRNASGAITPTPPSDTTAGIAPVLLYASIGLDVYIDTGNVLRVAFYPVAVLSNPYPVAINAANYDLGFRLPANANLLFQVAAPVLPANTAPGTFNTVATMNLGTPAIVAGTSAGATSNFIHFTLTGSIIPPGESHVYLIDAGLSGSNYAPGASLVRAPNSATIGLSNHLLFPDALTLDASVTSDSFLRVQLQNTASIDVVLAQAGSVNTPSGWYQSCNVMMSNGVTTLINTAASNQRILNNWDVPTSEARAALRFGSPLEHRGNYSQMAYFGMPTQAMSWLRFANIRAPFIRSTTLESAAPGLPSTQRSGAIPFGAGFANDPIPARNVALFPVNNAHVINLSGNADASTSSTNYTTLFDVLDSPDRLLSLGQLQNAPLSRYCFYPSYPLGNSMADPRVDRLATYRNSIVVRPGTTATLDPYYDLSWHLNRALWDRYFVSGVPSTYAAPGDPLPNSRMVIRRSDAGAVPLDELRYTGGTNKAYNQAAAHLIVSGAFNINSTSEQAWRAILGGSLGVPAHSDYAATGPAGDKVEQIVPFARLSHNLARPGVPPYPAVGRTMAADSTTDPLLRRSLYHGNRGLHLDDPKTTSTNTSATAVVNELARTIVREIRTRGPFLSISDFINRPILATKDAAGIKGALQNAIDTMEPAAAQANPFTAWNSAAGATMVTSSLLYASWDSEHYIGGPTSEVGTNRDSFRFNYSFSPKYLTQADVVSSLGPQLTARSDTFVIRTYGETINPVTQEIEGRAWCEAVVQRLPDYVAPSINQPADTASGANITFGRRLKIVSFRWLTPSEI